MGFDEGSAKPIAYGVTFERAAAAFFDPFLRVVDAGRNDEARDALIGYDGSGQMLFVIHVEIVHPKSDEEAIRIISARKATLKEREHYDT